MRDGEHEVALGDGSVALAGAPDDPHTHMIGCQPYDVDRTGWTWYSWARPQRFVFQLGSDISCSCLKKLESVPAPTASACRIGNRPAGGAGPVYIL